MLLADWLAGSQPPQGVKRCVNEIYTYYMLFAYIY